MPPNGSRREWKGGVNVRQHCEKGGQCEPTQRQNMANLSPFCKKMGSTWVDLGWKRVEVSQFLVKMGSKWDVILNLKNDFKASHWQKNKWGQSEPQTSKMGSKWAADLKKWGQSDRTDRKIWGQSVPASYHPWHRECPPPWALVPKFQNLKIVYRMCLGISILVHIFYNCILLFEMVTW